MKKNVLQLFFTGFLCLTLIGFVNAQTKKKPNIIMVISDDTGWGDLGVYGGGVGRGMPTPNLDKMAKEGMQFWDFYGQPSCTPGRAAMLTGRIPNRSGMTTVAFQGQGGGLPAAEWTLASVLKKANYKTYMNQRLVAESHGRHGLQGCSDSMAHRSTNFVHKWVLSSAFLGFFCAMDPPMKPR